jgi:UDP-N-acetylglucosamine 4-epimerase
LVTGAAGFIGSHLVEELLAAGQNVVGLDNFSTGIRLNLESVQKAVGTRNWSRFKFIEGDICDEMLCAQVTKGIDYVLHQAALGSVPRSIREPLRSHESNVTGFLKLLLSAQKNGVKRFVYASSSSVYGDYALLPKVEDKIGQCLSPYAATKLCDEVYAGAMSRCYGVQVIGLRYFNVFGPRQNPLGPYAAVIPVWIKAMIESQPVVIHGDGTTSRDFCYVKNVVQANVRAAKSQASDSTHQVYNVATHARTTLRSLFYLIRNRMALRLPHVSATVPKFGKARPGDVRHSLADISKARRLLGYRPEYSLSQGLGPTLDWYVTEFLGNTV